MSTDTPQTAPSVYASYPRSLCAAADKAEAAFIALLDERRVAFETPILLREFRRTCAATVEAVMNVNSEEEAAAIAHIQRQMAKEGLALADNATARFHKARGQARELWHNATAIRQRSQRVAEIQQ